MVSVNFLSGPIIMIITSAGALALVVSGLFRQSVSENMRLDQIRSSQKLASHLYCWDL